MRSGGRCRHAAAGNTVDRRVAGGAADDRRSPFLNRSGFAGDQLRFGKIRRRVVDRIDADRQGHFGACARLVGGGDRSAAHPGAVERHEFDLVGVMLAIVVQINQLAGGQLSAGDDVADVHRNAIQCQAAVRWQLGDPEAQRLVDGVAGFRRQVGNRVVGVAQSNIAGQQGDRLPSGDEGDRRSGQRRIVLWRDAERERLYGADQFAVRDGVGEVVVENLVAVMHESDPTQIHILLSKRLIDQQPGAVEGYRAAGRQRMQAVDQLAGRLLGVGGVEHAERATGQRLAAAFQDVEMPGSSRRRGGVDRQRQRQGVAVDRLGGRHGDAEGVDGQRAVLRRVVVNTSVARIGQNALAAVFDGEVDTVGAWRAARLLPRNVNQCAGIDVGLRETGAESQQLATEHEIAEVGIRHRGQGVGQIGRWRIDVADPQHGVGDDHRRAAQRLRNVVRQHRVVVVGVNVQVDRRGGRRADASPTTGVGDRQIEAVEQGFAAVMTVGQQADIGDDERRAWRGRQDRRAGISQRAVSWQAGDLVRKGRIVRIDDVDPSAVAADEGGQGAVVVQADVAFTLDDRDVGGDRGCLIDRIDMYGEHLIGEQAAGAVVERQFEGIVGPAGPDLTTVMGIGKLLDIG